ncbi:hypothetical protein F503_06478 [Ophiostoma piceae UAMH 11346]|uniref:Uncharacterized protein n=1 Tax=Ophiostoma piceae (strain UAMH 11346) TaxID=1262450 RepID=S3BTK0_OPHP1|nr:hypothetical protein F503_06478 [Ophiostoma piceae UAMH 11346]
MRRKLQEPPTHCTSWLQLPPKRQAVSCAFLIWHLLIRAVTIYVAMSHRVLSASATQFFYFLSLTLQTSPAGGRLDAPNAPPSTAYCLLLPSVTILYSKLAGVFSAPLPSSLPGLAPIMPLSLLIIL